MSASRAVDLLSLLGFLAFLAFVARVVLKSLKPDPQIAQLRAEVAALRKEIRQQGHTSA